MNNTLTIINKCLEFIEDNLKEKLTLDIISSNLGVSKFHLHRLFKELMGQNLMDYFNLRKLSSSITDLIETDFRIIDIAAEYGFDYEQNYIRSFKKAFGVTPLKAKTSKMEIRITEKIDISEFTEVQEAVIYRPHFVFKPQFHIVGMKYKIFFDADETLATSLGKKFFYSEKHLIHGLTEPNVYYGYTYWDENSTHDHTYYIPSVRVSSCKQIPQDMTFTSIPSNKYAVFKLIGFFNPDDICGSDLDSIMDYMYGKWIIQSGYEMAGSYRFEYIDTNISKDNYCELNLYLPIRTSLHD